MVVYISIGSTSSKSSSCLSPPSAERGVGQECVLEKSLDSPGPCCVSFIAGVLTKMQKSPPVYPMNVNTNKFKSIHVCYSFECVQKAGKYTNVSIWLTKSFLFLSLTVYTSDHLNSCISTFVLNRSGFISKVEGQGEPYHQI